MIKVFRACCAGLVAVGWTAGAVHAEPRSWDGGGGGDTRWQNAANWNPNGVPSSTSDVTLGSGITSNLIDSEGFGLTANSLLISTANTFTLFDSSFFGLGTLTLTSGDLTRQDVAGVEGNHTLIPALLAADGLWNVGGSGKLFVSIGESGGSRTFTKTGSGTLASSLGVTGAKTFNAGIFEGSINGAGAATFASGAAFHVPALTTTTSPVTLTGLDGGGFFVALNKLGTQETTLSGQVTLGGNNVNISADVGGKLTLSGGITDNGLNRGFDFFGNGELEVTGPGTFSGNVLTLGGQLTVGHNSALGTGQVFVSTVGSGSILAFNDGITFSNPITMLGTQLRGLGNSIVTSGITLNGSVFPTNNVLDVPNASHTLTVSGNISEAFGGCSVTKTGSGMVILGGSNSFTGGLTVQAGVLGASNGAGLSGSAPTVVQSGARLDLLGSQTFNSPVQISGPGVGGLGALRSASGNNTLTGAIAIQSNVSLGAAAASSLTVSGPITGGFGLTKVDDGTLRLTNAANAFTSLTIADGALLLSSHTGIPAAVPINVSAAGAVSLLNSSPINRTVNLNGTGASAAVGALDNEAGDNTWAGPVNLQSASTISSRAGSLTVAGTVSGAFPITKIGPGVLTLAGSNSHGDTSIQQGVLAAQSNGALPAGRTVTVASGGTLQVGIGVTTVASAALRLNGQGSGAQGALSIAQGAGTFAGPVTLVTDAAIGAAAGATITLSGQVYDDTAPLPLVKVGPGTLVLTVANTYRGGTLVNGGTLSINGDANLGDAAGQVTLNNGAKLQIASSMTTARTFNLGTGSVQVNAGVTYTYNNATVSGGFLRGPGTHAVAGTSTSFSGITALPGNNVVQNGPLLLNNFNSAGALVSNAPLTWDGGFNLGGGSVTVNSTLATQAFENDGLVTLNNGGTLTNSGNDLASTGGSRITINPGGALQLGGTNLNLFGALATNNGTISGTTNVHFGSLAKGTGTYGVVNVFDGGEFSPGTSPGIVTATSVDFDDSPFASGGPTLAIEIGGTAPGTQYDRLNVTGQLSLGGTLEVALVNDFNPAAGNSFDILNWGALSGTFASINLPALTAGLAWNTSQLYSTGVVSVATPGFQAADFDEDGDVDGRDFLAWQRGQSPDPFSAADLVTWQTEYNGGLLVASITAATALTDMRASPVPEPSAILLFIACLPCFMRRDCRQC